MTTNHARSFAPVVDDLCRVLILGSLPGRVSLSEGRYYANPRNQFWRLTGDLVCRPLEALDYEERLAALKAAGIGLWDAIERADREGSGDSAIRNPAANPLGALVARLPRLEAIGFNGRKSEAVALRALPPLPGLALILLPSSSPACAIGYAAKRDAWRRLLPHLQ